MADNYLEKKFEALYGKSSQGHSSVKRPLSPYKSLNYLLLKNRSYRGYDPSHKVTMQDMLTIIDVNNKIPSARNQQVLRFRVVLEDEADGILPHIKLGGALPQMSLPLPGTEPRAFIIICATTEENKWVDMDLGISCQSMLLQAVELGLNGICIGAFDKEAVTRQFGLPYPPLLILAVGKGAETIQLTSIEPSENHNYYRKDGLHLVPKIKTDLLLIKKP